MVVFGPSHRKNRRSGKTVSVLDLAFIRQQFPAFSAPSLQGQRHFENAGGSWACQHTIDALSAFYQHTKLQPYHPHPSSQSGGAAMDRAYQRWAARLNVAVDELTIGPSTSINTYVLAQAFADKLSDGDDVIVTNQDHEANGGVWRKMAERCGATLHQWPVDPETGLLDPAVLESLLSERTRLVCLPHCSNIVAHKNPIAAWVKRVRAIAPQAFVVVDGVSQAPHELPDVDALACDAYYFSLYKVFSVHQGVLVVRTRLADFLPNQSHFFNADHPQKRFNPAGPDHAQVAASAAVLDYFDQMIAHHGFNGQAEWNQAVADHEAEISQPLLDYLAGRNDVRLLGPTEAANRQPTISFVPKHHTADVVGQALGVRGIACGTGHFYGYRLVEAMGADPDLGVVRLSMVHYSSRADVEAAIEALDAVL